MLASIKDVLGMEAEDAAKDAARIQAGAQREALDYLREVDAAPQKFRTLGVTSLGGMYGIGTPQEQAQAFQAFESSPVSQYFDGLGQATLNAQEESIARHQAATGGLRSGSTQRALADVNAQAEEQRKMAKLQQYLGGLGQLSQLQTRPESIYQGMTNIGGTIGSGLVAGAQARQQGINNLLNIGSQFAGAMSMSDERLKDNVQKVGIIDGHEWHTWTWNAEAEKLGLTGDAEGVIAQRVMEYKPEAVSLMDNGYYAVDYSNLGS